MEILLSGKPTKMNTLTKTIHPPSIDAHVSSLFVGEKKAPDSWKTNIYAVMDKIPYVGSKLYLCGMNASTIVSTPSRGIRTIYNLTLTLNLLNPKVDLNQPIALLSDVKYDRDWNTVYHLKFHNHKRVFDPSFFTNEIYIQVDSPFTLDGKLIKWSSVPWTNQEGE